MQVVASTPLVSIDLIVKNEQGHVLLGMRNNEPAAGYWFVPGGCIRKNETLDEAFTRISEAELGVRLHRRDFPFYGAYEHFYDTNAGKLPGFGTHYVVLAHEVVVDSAILKLPEQDQHADWRWATPADILADESVHFHSQQYFSV
ncbi:GDP-mannose mannosyl hydrolase [Burkholderiaceae bacterium DAT-1]|nr:GDP-mannose mannosyl hydrolase [Burkholderiaceae bacterium DAT-1]